MLLGHRLLLLGVLALPAFSGCGSMSQGSESGTNAQAQNGGSMPTPPVTPPKAGPVGGGVSGTHNKVSATASVDTLAVAAGTSQTITVTFTSADGLPISGFSVYGSLGTLPAGWSSPTSLTCAMVAPGSGCVLALTYAPAAVETGTLTLDCVYVDNAGLPRTPGPCMTLAYAATASNHVVASVSPSGEIDANVGGKQTVSVNFTTDDGNAVTALTLTTNLGALPSGWSSKATGLNCAVVSTGNGCQLALDFAPAAAAAGTLTLNYSYTDASGAAMSGAVNVPYAATSRQTVVASVSPNGQINAAQKGGQQSVGVTFTSDDGNAARGLRLISDLTKLPAGWSSTSTAFGCDSVSTGNGCQLQLKFAPTVLGGGTLTLRYSYNDAGGMPNFGLLTIPYAATTNDNVVGTASPTGQIVAMLGSPAQAVSVAFTTDDNRLATALQVTSNLAALPPGWTNTAGSFACSFLGTGSTCQLILDYAPTGVDNGTLTLHYAYVNNADEAKTGSVAIDYRTTTNDNVVAAVNPTSLSVVTGSGSNPVMVTFTTDDGNDASSLWADLSVLPADWSSTSSTFTCATINVGTGCQVSLNYTPTVAAAGTLSFGYSYVNSAGTAKTGSVSIPYNAAP
ncbi:MAG TPA: hypothetical protein VK523_06845 [Steroidobacteraceae bacterium]|nr:hypothetical protein [Steroidobacteraceae bacterium]